MIQSRGTVAKVPLGWAVFAFLLAPLVGAIGYWIARASLFPFWRVVRQAALFAFIDASAFAYLTALILGVPAYLLFQGRVRLTWHDCALAGVVITCLALMAFGLALNSGPNDWQDLAMHLPFFVGPGALAGVAFWVIAAAGAKRTA